MTDELPAPIAEGSYEWYRREVERLRGERDSLAEMLEQLPDSHVKLGDVARVGGEQCVPWCSACLRQRAEQAEAERDAAHALLQTALHLRMHGEHAPGGTETWRDWEHATETHLRAALDPPSAPESQETTDGHA